jgi:interleukin-1 receptor-associated kinase 4
VYELCAGGALDQALMDDARASELTWKLRVRVALGICAALHYMHKGGGGKGAACYHRDVKAANICLTQTLQPKLIDCGLAKFIPTADQAAQATATEGRPGTPGYKCNRYERTGDFVEKSEVYSFGIVLLELITGNVQVWKCFELAF